MRPMPSDDNVSCLSCSGLEWPPSASHFGQDVPLKVAEHQVPTSPMRSFEIIPAWPGSLGPMLIISSRSGCGSTRLMGPSISLRQACLSDSLQDVACGGLPLPHTTSYIISLVDPFEPYPPLLLASGFVSLRLCNLCAMLFASLGTHYSALSVDAKSDTARRSRSSRDSLAGMSARDQVDVLTSSSGV